MSTKLDKLRQKLSNELQRWSNISLDDRRRDVNLFPFAYQHDFKVAVKLEIARRRLIGEWNE